MSVPEHARSLAQHTASAAAQAAALVLALPKLGTRGVVLMDHLELLCSDVAGSLAVPQMLRTCVATAPQHTKSSGKGPTILVEQR